MRGRQLQEAVAERGIVEEIGRVGEVMEEEYRKHVENKKPLTDDEKTMNKIMGKGVRLV